MLKSHHLSVFIVASVIMFDGSSQQQQQVQFFPINNWNCNDATEKLCAVDTAAEMLQTSSLTECSVHCLMKLLQCLQFNYYSSPATSPNCHLYHRPPKNYIITPDCQHYVVGV